MELKFEKAFNEIQNLIENYCEDEDHAYDLFDKLTEHDYKANCSDTELMKLIKSDKEYYKEIMKLYRISKGVGENEK